MNGHLSAMVSYATHLVPNDERAAFVWFRAAAERGDPRAWYELGQLLARGRYFEVNAVDAARCWKRAAQMGDNTGKSALGLCYIRGFGVKQDLDKGVEIVKQVADVHNDVTAMKNLAWIFRYGKGVPKDLGEAEYWDKRAKEQEQVMLHMSSREQVLFGRSRSSKHSKHKPREAEKQSVGSTAAVASAASSSTQTQPPAREPTPPQPSQTPTSDYSGPPKESMKDKITLPAYEHERRLHDVANEQLGASTSSHNFDTDAGIVRSFSPNPVRGAHLPDGALEGTTQAAPPSPAREGASHEEPRIPEIPRARPSPVPLDDQLERNNKIRKEPDPALALELENTSFIQKMPSEVGSTAAPPGDVAEEPLPVKKPECAPKYEQLIGSDPSQRDTQNNSASLTAPHISTLTKIGSNNEEQFTTPDESLENAEASDALNTVAVYSGDTAFDRNPAEEAVVKRSKYGDGRLANEKSEVVQSTVKSATPNQNASSDAANNTGDTQKTQNPKFVPKPPHTLEPGILSRKKMFEADDNEEASAGKDWSQSDVSKTPSYAVQPEESNHDDGEFDELEAADFIRVTSTAEQPDDEPSQPNSDALEHVSETEQASRGAGSLEEKSFPGSDKLEVVLLEPQPADGEGSSSVDLTRVRELLANYPHNPLRTDALPMLVDMLVAVQDIQPSNIEAYDVIERESGYAKVVVAMIAHHEDENIQEQGLHCLVRLIRATPTNMQEDTLLISYADCYRTALAKADAVISKGSSGVDERSSGGIQAIVVAVQTHSSVRRIQLAGCAAFGEIAGVSPSCRTLLAEHGGIRLILEALKHRSSPAAAAIHDIAGRAVSKFCAGKENMSYKESFTSAGAVGELLSVVQLWGHSEDSTSDIMVSATTSCCGALRHVTDGYITASTQCVQLLAFHHLVRVMTLRRDDVNVCTVVLAALTSITRNAGPVAEKALLEAKPLPEVLTAMQKHPDNPTFIRKALDFMESLGSFSSMKEEIVVAGGIPFAADIIQQGGPDHLLLERACGVVEKLCRTNPANQEIFAASHGVQSLTSVLSSHERQPVVTERALLALTSVCSNNPHNQRESVRVGTPEILMRVLTVYSGKNAKVVAAVSGAMSALVVPKNMAMAQTFAGLKAPELVVRAMKRHPDNVMVQENGSAAVAAFCEADPHIMTSLLKSGITTILVVALQRFLHKQTAVVQIVRAMRAITNEVVPEDSYRFKSKLLTDRSNESSLPEIFHTALSFHKKSLPETANVIISICATINRLCMRSVAFKNEVGKDGIVEELKRLVERTAEFKELGALQPVLATICTLVLESEENKNRFHAVGGVEAILDVMQRWKHDTYVLEHCCAALRYSCNDHFGNCHEVKNHNGVRSILGVMEMHPENVNVTLWCCLTLADLCKGDEELQSSGTVMQGIRKVVAAMNMFSQNSRFLASACEFLRAASVCNDENKERIVRLGGRTAIVKALEMHPSDNTLTESAAYALLQIQDVADRRSSTEGSAQGGGGPFMKRISREFRRSGSSSARSNRSSKGKMGRKSLSFSSRRRSTNDDVDEDGREESHERDEGRHTKGSSLINLQRLITRRRSRSARMAEAEEDMEDTGADDGYGEYGEYGHEDDGRYPDE